MRDIGTRIGRYRLSRYAPPSDPVRRRLRWFWLAALVWMVWVAFLSKGSFYRLWRFQAEQQRIAAEIDLTRTEIATLEKDRKDPRARRERTERQARQAGMAKPGEIVYRIRGPASDSTER